MIGRRSQLSSGFTLLELLVVIGIIGLLASIVLVATNQSREKSRNAAKLAQLEQMIKVIHIHHAETGEYPLTGTGVNGALRCLGSYPGDSCWNNGGTGRAVNAAFEAYFVPEYFREMPPLDTILVNDHYGAIYRSTLSGQGYQIFYYLQGDFDDVNCQLPNATKQNIGGFARCLITVTS